MATQKRFRKQSGGVNIKNSRVTVGGDLVGRDKTTTIGPKGKGDDLEKILEQFSQIKQKIDQRTEDPDIDKAELRTLVENIEQELKKGESANPNKVKRWLKFLAEMADDIFQVTVATLTHPVAGVAKAIQLVAQQLTK